MRKLTLPASVLIVCCLLGGEVLSEEQEPAVSFSFRALDLWVDSGKVPLAAYQVAITYDKKQVKILGLEGGPPGPFNAAPYYDDAGKQGGRIVLASFTTDDDRAPAGRTRVGRLHLMVTGDDDGPACTVKLITAAKPGGERISANVELSKPSAGANEGEKE